MAGPHFGVEQCKSYFLLMYAHLSLDGCGVPGLVRNHMAIAGVCFACSTKRETHQTGFIRSPLSESVYFVVQGCSVCSAILPWSYLW